MDPFSIAASAITLVQAAGYVSTTLHDFIKTYRNADTRVSDLCHQLSSLVKFLEAVDATIKRYEGSPLSVIAVDNELWEQSAVSLEDCKTTLEELRTFINKITASSKSTSPFRRAKVAVDLTIYAGDISGFEQKILKSNWALQTMLSAIQVSFSMRGSETQHTILNELQRLKHYIEQSLRVASYHGNGFSHDLEGPDDARIAYNLRALAHVAQNFHSSASSMASTVHGPVRTSFWGIQSDAAMSVRGGAGLTNNKRERVDQFVKQQRRMTQRRKPLHRDPSSAAASIAPPRSPARVIPKPMVNSDDSDSEVSEIGDDNDDGDDDLELFLLSGLEEVAKDNILNQDFPKAQAMLEEAIQRHMGSTSADADVKQLQIQLAMCYFFQHKWRLAEPLIDLIAKSKSNFDPVICNLLHALALANLSESRLTKAIAVCKKALQGKRRLKRVLGSSSESECNETIGLLANIYELNGQNLEAEGYRRKLSSGYFYTHPENEVEFIVKHPRLCDEVFGTKINFSWNRPLVLVARPDPVVESPDIETQGATGCASDDAIRSTAMNKAPLQTFESKLVKYEMAMEDTSKEVIHRTPSLVPDEDLTKQPKPKPYIPDDEHPQYRFRITTKQSSKHKLERLWNRLRNRPTMPNHVFKEPRPSKYMKKKLAAQSNPDQKRSPIAKVLQTLGIKTSKAKPASEKKTKPVQSSFTLLSMTSQQPLAGTEAPVNGTNQNEESNFDHRPWRYGVDDWLRNGVSAPHTNASVSQWVTASQILSDGAEKALPVELPDNSIQRPVELDTSTRSLSVNQESIPSLGIQSNPYSTPEIASETKPAKPNLRIEVPEFGRKIELLPSGIQHAVDELVALTENASDYAEAVNFLADSDTLTSTTPIAASNEIQSEISRFAEIVETLFNEEEVEVGQNVGESKKKTVAGGAHEGWMPASYFKDPLDVPFSVESKVDKGKAREIEVQSHQPLKFSVLSPIREDTAEAQLDVPQPSRPFSPPPRPSSPKAIPPHLRRKFSWESMSEAGESISISPTVSTSTASEPKTLNHQSSWSSGNDSSNATPSLTSSASSESLKSSASSISNDSTIEMATKETTAPFIKGLDLPILDDDEQQAFFDLQELDEFLENLSESIVGAGKCRRCQAKHAAPLLAFSGSEQQISKATNELEMEEIAKSPSEIETDRVVAKNPSKSPAATEVADIESVVLIGDAATDMEAVSPPAQIKSLHAQRLRRGLMRILSSDENTLSTNNAVRKKRLEELWTEVNERAGLVREKKSPYIPPMMVL